MNYKKVVAGLLALSMVVPVVATTNVGVLPSISVSASETSEVSYEYVYSYDTELEATTGDEDYTINVDNVDNVRVIVPNSSGYVGFNVNYESGYLGWFGANANDDGDVIIDIDTSSITTLVLFTTADLSVYSGTAVGIKQSEKATSPIDMSYYDTLTFTLSNSSTTDYIGCNVILYYLDDGNAVAINNPVSVWIGTSGTSEVVVPIVKNASDVKIDVECWEDLDDGYVSADDMKDYISMGEEATLSKECAIPTVSDISIYTKQADESLALDGVASIVSSDTDVAIVDSSNVVTGVAEGTATLTLTYINGDTADVQVEVKGLKFANDSKTVSSDDADVDLNGELASGTATKWTSSNEKVATVDSKGVLTPVAEGTTTITAEDAFGNSATITVTVTADEVVNVDKTVINLETTDTETIKVTSGTATKWASSDEDVATVEDGVVTAVGEGTATISVTSKDGIDTVISVTVTNPTPIEASYPTSKNGNPLIVNEEVTISVDKGVATSWKSSDTKVATVDEDGNVKAIGEGTAVITATDKVGNISKVDVEVKSFSLNRSFLNLGVGDSYQLSANDSDTVASFKSSDTDVATVDEKGNVKAVSTGTTTVTATDVFGNVVEVPVSVFDATDYATEEVSTTTDEDGNGVVTVNKGDATELQLNLSSTKAQTASGVVLYMDGDTAVEVPWVIDFSKGTATTYVGNLPSDVEEVTFRVDYAGYWDSSKNQWIDTNSASVPVELSSAKGNTAETTTDDGTILPSDILALKKYLLGITTPKNTSKFDYNGDGTVNLLDLLLAKRTILGLTK